MIENTRVYYNDRCIIFTLHTAAFLRETSCKNAQVLMDEKVLDQFEEYFDRFLLSDFDTLIIRAEPNASIERLKQVYKFLIAGGGIVNNERNELLLIYRLGNWDLPKGKLEKGEEISACAVREVEEETGIHSVEIKEFVENSYHLYIAKDKMILKETVWYTMYAPYQDLIGQAEEGIEKAIWVPQNNLEQHIRKSYASIQHVLRKWL